MKRDLLAKSLANMNNPQAQEADKASEAQPPRSGAPKSLQNMSDVLSQVTSQAAQEVDPSEIADSEVADRFDVNDGLEDLIETIKQRGQQIPALVRYRRGEGPRYEVVYGRRRIAACRALGIKVKTYIKEMDLREALMCQALENSARMERSFIEQAVFATKLEHSGFSRQEICEALAVDKGTLSRLIGVVRDVPELVVRAIGAAHDSGRRPWVELRRLVLLENAPGDDELLSLVPADDTDPNSRLVTLIEHLQEREARDKQAPKGKAGKSPSPAPITPITGGSVRFKSKDRRITILADKADQEFIKFLGDSLEEIYLDWTKTRT